MLDKSAIYYKSVFGQQALARRDPALVPKLRSLLILVDGRRGYDELAKLGRVLGDVDALLEQLEREGFIENLGGWSETEPAPLRREPPSYRT